MRRFVDICSGLPSWIAIEPPQSAMGPSRYRTGGADLTDDEMVWAGEVIEAISIISTGSPQIMEEFTRSAAERVNSAIDHWIGEDRLRTNFPVAITLIDRHRQDRVLVSFVGRRIN